MPLESEPRHFPKVVTMPKPWQSLSLTKNNVGRSLTAAQVKKLRPEIATIGQLVSERGEKAMREILKLSDAAIQEVIEYVKPKGETAAEEKKEKADKPVATQAEKPDEKKAENDGDTPEPVQHEDAHVGMEKSAPAAVVHAAVKDAPAKEQVMAAPEQKHVAGGVKELSMLPETERVSTILSDKQRANGTGPFADGAVRITPAASIGPITQQAGLATVTAGDSRAEIASQFNPVTGIDSVLPQNRDGDDGRLAFATTHPADSTAAFATGKQAGFTRGNLPKGVRVVKVGTENVTKPDGVTSKDTIAEAIRDAVDSIRGESGGSSATAAGDAANGGNADDKINELRPFLPIAGAEDVMPPAGSDQLKRENLVLFDFKPPGWVLGDAESNPLVLSNLIDQGIRWAGKLNDLPSVHPGGSLTQGARPYESYMDVTSGAIRDVVMKRKASTMSGYAAAATAVKRTRGDASFTAYNPATQGVNDGVYNGISDSNPLVSELMDETEDPGGMDLRVQEYPCPLYLHGLMHNGPTVQSTGIDISLHGSGDYNPVASRPGVTMRIV